MEENPYDSSDPVTYLDSSGNPTLTSSTGKKDGSSVWGSGLLSGLNSLTQSAGNILGGLNGKKKPAAKTNWMPFAIGGAALLLVLVLVMSFSRR